MKKIVFFLIVILNVFCFSVLNLNSNSYDFSDETYDNYPIFDTYSELVQSMNEAYDYLNNYYLTCDSTYAMLSIINFDQTDLRDSYNLLGDMRFDLNNDGIINDNDNLGQTGGICQPTACATALKYMIDRNLLSYTPRISNDYTNINDIFYEVVDRYISNGWGGNGSLTSLAVSSLNDFFTDINSSYTATLTTSNYLSNIRTAFSNRLPCIGHLSLNSTDNHAVTICGYYIMTVHYTYWSNDITLDFPYLIINDGWNTSGYSTGSNTQEVFDANFSYISLNYLYSLTYIS